VQPLDIDCCVVTVELLRTICLVLGVFVVERWRPVIIAVSQNADLIYRNLNASLRLTCSSARILEIESIRETTTRTSVGKSASEALSM
jgi:hypothetical protein